MKKHAPQVHMLRNIKPNQRSQFQSFKVIINTKSLSSKLWNIALRSLNNRKWSSLEASDTLLGILLFSTVPAATI